MLVNLLVERKLTLTRSLLEVEGHKTSQHHVYFQLLSGILGVRLQV